MAIDINKIFIVLLVDFSNIGTSFVACNSANGIKKKKEKDIKKIHRQQRFQFFISLFLAGNWLRNSSELKVEGEIVIEATPTLTFYSLRK